MYKDIYDNSIFDCCIINIGQTVNGQSKFVILKVKPLDIRYYYDINREYEYDREDLLKPDEYTGESSFTIIGSI